jgi:SAM-dependent methyltransferase
MSELLNKVEKYYTEKLKKFGVSPKGVDWNSLESQFIRFQQLSNVIIENSRFSLLDYGCGYGALVEFLTQQGYKPSEYFGYDISEAMIKEASKNNSMGYTTYSPHLPSKSFDYVIASRIFSVKMNLSEDDWAGYIIRTLHELNRLSDKGFSFNMLTSYSDMELMRENLFYANPSYYFDYCKSNFSKSVALLHDYPLYEFSIIVRK